MEFKIESDKIFLIDDSQFTKTFVPVEMDISLYVTSAWCLSEITDDYGNKLLFSLDQYARPTSVSFKPTNASQSTVLLNLVYDNSNRLSYIYNPTTMDSVVLRYSESYDGNIITAGGKYLRQVEFLSGIHTTSEETTVANIAAYQRYNYNNTNIAVTASYSYTYDVNGKITKITDDALNKKIRYSWNEDKISTAWEEANSLMGQAAVLTYASDCTTVRSSGNDDVILNSDDVLTRYIFDEKGRTVSMYSTSIDGSVIYGATSGTYDDDVRENSLKYKTVLGGTSINYLLNGDFEEFNSDKTFKYWNQSSRVSRGANYSLDEGYNAPFFIPVSTVDASISQIVFLPAGSYNLSMIYASRYCTMYRAEIILSSVVGSSFAHLESLSLNENSANKKVDYSTSFEVENFVDGGDFIEVKIIVTCDTFEKSADFYVDNVMLCSSEGASDYSLVSYGGFNATSYGNNANDIVGIDGYWSGESESFEYVNISSDIPEFSDVLKIKKNNGEAIVKQRIYQINDFDLTHYATEDFKSNAYHNYIVSGFAYAPTGVSSDTGSSKFRIGIDVYYYQGSEKEDVIKTYYFDFLSDIATWQFISGMFSTDYTPEDANDKNKYNCVRAIDIFCEYSNQANCDAYFDNISVIRADSDNYEEYYYYSEGSSKGLLAMTYTTSYAEYYVYDEYKNLTAVATSDGDMVLYEYDTGGANKRQLNAEIQCEYSYDGAYYLPLDYEDPVAAVSKYYKSKTEYTYDQYGNNTSITIYPLNKDSANLPAGSKKMQSSATYDTITTSVMFGTILSETDFDGTTVYYYYDADTCRLQATMNSSSYNGLVYTYDRKGALESVFPGYYVSDRMFSSVSSAERVDYTYGEDNLVNEIKTNSTTYGLSYDSFGNKVSFDIGDSEIASYEYNQNNGKLIKTNYANGFSVEYVYNALEMVKEIWYNNSDGTRVKAYEYEYTIYGNIRCIKDNISDTQTEYTYDDRNRVTVISSTRKGDTANGILSYNEFNADGNLNRTTVYVDLCSGDSDDTHVSYLRYYNADLRDMSRYHISGRNVTASIGFTYDEFHRLSSSVFGLESFVARYEYEYKTNGDKTTPIVESVTTVINDTSTKTVNYTYDYDGNITKITYSDGKVIEYTYDKLGQLTSEKNDLTGKYVEYSYSLAGNIEFIKEYPKDSINEDSCTVKNYIYNNTKWGDLLTFYNGVSISYDEIGNPISYFNGARYTFGWQGRRLVSAKVGAKNMSFTYNDDGLRVSKTVNGVTTNYYYQGSLLYAEETNSQITVYLYDQNGAPIGFQYRSASYEKDVWDVYAYEKNIFGDVVAVYDNDGELIISYTYNAWGECKTTVHSSVPTAVANNPYRYRGYYYDVDLGIYYLQSRYYDAKTCRFISADGYASTGQGLLGYNMYAYCGNNPLNRIDQAGQFWSEIFGFAKATVTEIGRIMGVISPAYAGCGIIAIADGALPNGDIVAITGAALLTVSAIGYGIYLTTKAPSLFVPNVEEKSDTTVIPKESNGPLIFPVNPNTFNPVGLVKVSRVGTKNGVFISWMDPLTNTEVFRWDENPNYANGPHYHIHGTGHYYPGMIIPEPYATIYFPFS